MSFSKAKILLQEPCYHFMDLRLFPHTTYVDIMHIPYLYVDVCESEP